MLFVVFLTKIYRMPENTVSILCNSVLFYKRQQNVTLVTVLTIIRIAEEISFILAHFFKNAIFSGFVYLL